MKFTLIIDKDSEEELILRIKEKREIADKIEQLLKDVPTTLFGYDGIDTVPLSKSEIYAIFLEDSKLYAMTENKKYRLKMRLYEVEEIIGEGFVKINQSCVANIKMIKRFDASISGQLTVYFQNGYRDYVSRRHVSAVKRAVGIK